MTIAVTRRPRRLRLLGGAVAAAALAAFAGCGGEGSDPLAPSDAGPGVLAVQLAAPLPRAGAVLLTVAGPAAPTEIVAAQPGVVVHQRPAGAATSVALFGSIAAGELLRMRVPDASAAASYHVTVREVAGEDNALREDLGGYVATVAAAPR